MADYPPRPATPQAMVHRLPDKSDMPIEGTIRPSKFIILIAASSAVAGKVQVAQSVSGALSCPLFQGDSLHETAARAASVGVGRSLEKMVDSDQTSPSEANEERYMRMWLSKMTRTGLLFPEESRPAGGAFSGFGRTSPSTPTSRRGSSSSETSELSSSDTAGSTTSSNVTSIMSSSIPKYINRPPKVNHSGSERTQSAMLLVTHPRLESWHRRCIRHAVGEYAVGVIFVPLDDDEELPILKPLDPRIVTGFGSFSTVQKTKWTDEVVLTVNVDATVESIAEEIITRVKDILSE